MNQSIPKLSIVIPSYNNGNKLIDLLNSIKQQNFSDYEVLVIDGNSTDNTKDVIKKYKSIVSYFVSEKDQGIYDAMNKGIQASKGDWLYFIGCDDLLYESDTLSQVFHNETDEIQVLYGKIFNKRKQLAEGQEISSKEELICTSIWHQSVFYRRTIFEKYGYFDISYKIAADVVFNLSTFSQSFNKWKFMDVIVSVFSGEGISSHTIDLKYHQNQKKLFHDWFFDIEEHLIYSALQHHLYNEIKLGNYSSAMKEYVTLFLKTNDRFRILKHAFYYLKLRFRK